MKTIKEAEVDRRLETARYIRDRQEKQSEVDDCEAELMKHLGKVVEEAFGSRKEKGK